MAFASSVEYRRFFGPRPGPTPKTDFVALLFPLLFTVALLVVVRSASQPPKLEGKDVSKEYSNHEKAEKGRIMMREARANFAAYENLKGLPRADEALEALQKVASVVKPIMKKRGWRVGTLSEFLPDNSALLGLNINKTAKICLRLRYTQAPDQFLPHDNVLDCLLHELCHIVWSDHDTNFMTLWEELREELYSLKRAGYTGDGFFSDGHKLGGKRLPPHEARRQAAQAATNRRSLAAGSGQKLGGAPVRPGADIRKVIADTATRRIEITRGCASGAQDGESLAEEARKSGSRTMAGADDTDQLDRDIAIMEEQKEAERQEMEKLCASESGEGLSWSPEHGLQSAEAAPESPRPPQVSSRPAPSSLLTRPGKPVSRLVAEDTAHQRSTKSRGKLPSSREVIDLTSESPATPAPDKWVCEICTLENEWQHLVCDACGIEKPSPPGESSASPQPKPLGWNCHRCGTFMESRWWTCSGCGSMKAES